MKVKYVYICGLVLGVLMYFCEDELNPVLVF